jgi:hypothetical protein
MARVKVHYQVTKTKDGESNTFGITFSSSEGKSDAERNFSEYVLGLKKAGYSVEWKLVSTGSNS